MDTEFSYCGLGVQYQKSSDNTFYKHKYEYTEFNWTIGLNMKRSLPRLSI